MTADEEAIARNLADTLDRGTARLAPGTVYRLQNARQLALASLAEAQTFNELALGGSHSGTFRQSSVRGLRFWLAALLLITTVGGYESYQHWQTVKAQQDIEETDTAILTSELPVDAYLDHGFHNWLKSSGE